MSFYIRTWGEFACFTDPMCKVARRSYSIMTPSAARGIMEAIYMKVNDRVAQMQWVIRRIYVLNPIKWINLPRNEIRFAASRGRSYIDITGNIAGVATRIQRQQVMLRNVDYIIEADLNPLDGNFGKHARIFSDRAASGQYFHVPSFGLRECAAYYELVEDVKPFLDQAAQQGDRDFGWMFYDWDFANHCQRLLFRAQMRNGIVDTNPHNIVRQS